MKDEVNSMSDNGRRVYSTETGRICPDCGKPASKCACRNKRKTKKAAGGPSLDKGDGVVRIQRETKGRKGKTVTTVHGVPLAENELKDFAKTLKGRCGAGGTVKDGVIEIQGDHREILLEEIRKQGYPAKPAGG
jgi:translation initiation factor 1